MKIRIKSNKDKDKICTHGKNYIAPTHIVSMYRIMYSKNLSKKTFKKKFKKFLCSWSWKELPKKNFQNISMIVSYYDQISTSDTDAGVLMPHTLRVVVSHPSFVPFVSKNDTPGTDLMTRLSHRFHWRHPRQIRVFPSSVRTAPID